VYYADRRVRQAGHVRRLRQSIDPEVETTLSSTSQSITRDQVSVYWVRNHRRRSDSCPRKASGANPSQFGARRSRSVGDLALDPEQNDEYADGEQGVSIESSGWEHTRKWSSDVDSGIGIDEFDDGRS
jgi:hypothetical protein